MLPINLLQDFYVQASEHELATMKSENWDFKEYEHYMIELRRMIRFFYSLEEFDNYLDDKEEYVK